MTWDLRLWWKVYARDCKNMIAALLRGNNSLAVLC